MGSLTPAAVTPTPLLLSPYFLVVKKENKTNKERTHRNKKELPCTENSVNACVFVRGRAGVPYIVLPREDGINKKLYTFSFKTGAPIRLHKVQQSELRLPCTEQLHQLPPV